MFARIGSRDGECELKYFAALSQMSGHRCNLDGLIRSWSVCRVIWVIVDFGPGWLECGGRLAPFQCKGAAVIINYRPVIDEPC